MDNYEAEIWKEINNIRILTREEEIELGNRIKKGDKEAEKLLVYHNLRLVKKIASKHAKTSTREFIDIYQDGVIGLTTAAKKFDVTKNTKFSTVAGLWIEQYIRRNKENTDYIIRKPAEKVQFYWKIKRVEQELIKKLGQNPSIEQIALAMNEKEEKIKESIENFQKVTSINKEVKENENKVELGNFIEDKKENIEENVLKKLEAEEIRRILDQNLTEKEKYILEERFGFNGNNPKTLREIASNMDITSERVSQIEKKALKNLRKKLEKKVTLVTPSQKEVSYLDILKRYQDDSLNELINRNASKYNALDKRSISLLHKFFASPPTKELTEKQIEEAKEEINAILLKQKIEERIPLALLEEYFYNHIEKFTSKQIYIIEKYLFPKEKMIEKKEEKIHANRLLSKLERMYLGIDNIGKITFGKKEVRKVIEQYHSLFNKVELFFLYAYYGIECEKQNYEKMAEMLNMDPILVHDKFHNARTKAIHLFLGIVEDQNDDLSIYIPYIENVQYELTEETRKILSYFVIENLSYQEISEKTNLPKVRISNIIKDGLRKLDFYRLKINIPFVFSKEKLNRFYNQSKHKYTEKEKEVIEKRYFKGEKTDQIAEEMNMEKRKINIIFRTFHDAMLLFEVPPVENIEFIKKEINKKPIDSVLTEEEKKYLSMFYGIQNNWNKTGKKYTAKEIGNITSTPYDTITHKKREAKGKLRLRQEGKINPPYGIISSDNLERLLKDKYIPLPKDDIKLLKNILEIGKVEENIEKIIEEKNIIELSKTSNIKRKYQRAIHMLMKYENGEIKEKISFHDDIKPNFKYFSEYEKKLLIDVYQNELSASKIAQTRKRSIYQIQNDINKVKITLYSILNKKDIVTLYNFEEARKVWEDKDFNLGENHELLREIYELYYGENHNIRYTIPEIKEMKKLSYPQNQIYNFLIYTLTSIEKYKYGFYQKPLIEKEDISKFYINNKDKLTNLERKKIASYLEKSSKYYKNIPMSLQIAILNYVNKLPFSFSQTEKKQVIEILKDPLLEITEETKNTLYIYYGIRERLFMSIEEKKQIAKVLDSFSKEENAKVKKL